MGIIKVFSSDSKGFPDSSVGKESACNAGDPSSIPGLGRSAREGIGYPLWYSWASLPGGSAGKESTCNVGDLGLISGLGRCPGKGKGYSLQYSGLENSMDCCQWGCKELNMTKQLSLAGNTCWLTQHGIVLEKSFEVLRTWVRISDFLFSFIWPTRII